MKQAIHSKQKLDENVLLSFYVTVVTESKMSLVVDYIYINSTLCRHKK